MAAGLFSYLKEGVTVVKKGITECITELNEGITELFSQADIKKAIAKNKGGELKILVTGKTGQGKSTLINGILGAHVATEGAGAARCTTEIAKYEKVIEGVPVTVFDSPGLQDRTQNDEEYIRGMKEESQNLSLVLYCTKMINTRLTDDDKNAMAKLTEAFGEHFWSYAVFVLTFANMEDTIRKDDRDEDINEPDHKDTKAWKELKKRRFEGRLEKWKEGLQNFLIKEVAVDPKIACNIPVIPTGDSKSSYNNPHNLRLPDRDNWLNVFWETCCYRTKETSLFLQINSHRMVAEDMKVGESEDDEEEYEEDEEDKEDEELHQENVVKGTTKPATIYVTNSSKRDKAKMDSPLEFDSWQQAGLQEKKEQGYKETAKQGRVSNSPFLLRQKQQQIHTNVPEFLKKRRSAFSSQIDQKQDKEFAKTNNNKLEVPSITKTSENRHSTTLAYSSTKSSNMKGLSNIKSKPQTSQLSLGSSISSSSSTPPQDRPKGT